MKERAQPAHSSPFSTTHGSVIPNEAQRNEESPTCISGGGLCMIVGEFCHSECTLLPVACLDIRSFSEGCSPNA
jgi:hypothetical protein